MVAVDNDRWILRAPLREKAREVLQRLVMVVRVRDALAVHVTAQNRMRMRIAGRAAFPSAVDEIVLALRGGDSVHHHGQIATRRILHAHRAPDGAGRQAMLLILDATRAHSHVSQQVIHVFVVLGIQQLVGADKPRFLDDAHVHLAHGDDAFEQVGLCVGIGLMDKTLVTVTGGARLVRVDARDDQQLVGHFLLHGHQARNVVEDAVLVVRRTRTDDERHLVAFAFEDGFQLRSALLDHAGQLARQRIHFLRLHRDRKLPLEIHVHHVHAGKPPGALSCFWPSASTFAFTCIRWRCQLLLTSIVC